MSHTGMAFRLNEFFDAFSNDLIAGLRVINVCRQSFEFTFTDELCQVEDLFSTENIFSVLL